MDKPLPELYSISPDQITEVIEDLRLTQEDHARIYFAVDPYELRDFCFPVDPTKQGEGVNIKTVADDQAALFEVFHRQRAILLPEYFNEMGRMLTYFEMTSDRLRDKSEMVDRLIEEGQLEISEDDSDAQGVFLRENFSVVLAIAMGIFSLGVTRLQRIYHHNLIKGHFLNVVSPGERPVMKRILDSYKRTDHWEVILKQLRRPLWELEKDQSDQSRADEIDASAIDRIIYLNNAFEKARKDLDHRYLILYLSSAPKTIRLFTRSSVTSLLPSVNGRPYNFWRTRGQIFAYVVHRGVDHSESIANLRHVQHVLSEVRKFEGLFSSEDCNDCLLQVGPSAIPTLHDTRCRWRDFCEKVKGLDDEIQKARAQVHNLGLINTLSDYDELRSARPQSENQRQYLEFFREVFDSPLRKNARVKMQRLQRWIIVKSEFTNSFTEALGVGKTGLNQSALRSKKDFVTGLDQYLPTKPRLWSGRYKTILDSTLRFYRDPTGVGPIEDAYKRYVELDTETRGLDLEHELIRCFLYLALPRVYDDTPQEPTPYDGDERAYQHAQAIMHGDDLLNREEWDDSADPIKQEYRYVQCWAARRSGKFARAVELAEEGIEIDHRDPRFFHGLCLSIYSWLRNSPTDCDLKLQQATDAAEMAIRLYLDTAKDNDNDEVVASNYNNLAYLWAWSVEINQQELRGDRESDAAKNQQALDYARDALDKLKNVIVKSDWERTRHPEFFHTEAYLEYRESLVAFSVGDRTKARLKLNNANREIENALRLFEAGPGHEEYRALKERIDKGIELLV